MIYSIKINEDVDEFLERNKLIASVTHRFKIWKYLVHIDVDNPYNYDGDYTVSQDDGVQFSNCALDLNETVEVGSEEVSANWVNTVGYPIIPSDTSLIWHLDAVHSRGVNKASGSYTSSRDGAGVNIYILDTPLVQDHPEIVGRVTDVNNGLPDDTHPDWYTPPDGEFYPSNSGLTIANEVTHRHGLFVAMSAAGTSIGAAPGASIITVPCSTNTGDISTPHIELGLEAIVSHHLRQSPRRNAVINFSIGASFNPINNVVPHEGDPATADNYTFKHLFMDLQESYGIPVVKSAGNDDPGNFYKGVGHHAPFGTFNGGYITSAWNRTEGDNPLGLPSFTVGVSTKADTIAEWAAYGKSLLLQAPGESLAVPSANASLDAASWISGTHWWRLISGSSFSSPIVAGVIALFLQDKAIPTAAGISSTCTSQEVAKWLITNATSGVIDNIGSYEHTIDPFVTYQNDAGNSCVVVNTSERTYGYLDLNAAGTIVTATGVFNPNLNLKLDFTLHRRLPPNGPIYGGRYYVVKSIAGEAVRDGWNFDLDGTGATNWYKVCVDRFAFSSATPPLLTKDLTYHDDVSTSNLMVYNPYVTTTNVGFSIK
jgi:subtilisin family serine protease